MKSTRWTNIVLNEKCMCWCFIDYLLAPVLSFGATDDVTSLIPQKPITNIFPIISLEQGFSNFFGPRHTISLCEI